MSVYVGVAQAAVRTGRSQRTIQRWMQQRLLAGYRAPDGSRLVALDELMKIEQEKRRCITRRRQHALSLAAK